MSDKDLFVYGDLLSAVRQRIQQAQLKVAHAANASLLQLYWDVGRMIAYRQQSEGWGSRVIPRLSSDLRSELPEVKGFSERNIGRMIAFYRAYAVADSNLPQAVAKMDDLFFRLPWSHHIILLEKIKDAAIRRWYMVQVVENGWSRNSLLTMIRNGAHAREGAAVTNFQTELPAAQSNLAGQLLKDPYIFDFMTLEEPFRELELESGLVRHLEKFLLELGQGFAYVGRQYPLSVGEMDYYLDLLFYHFQLYCFVVVELKCGEFKPEYAGKMNFYCSVVDDLLRGEADQLTIGLILCQTKDRVVAEYALRDLSKPIGVSSYELTRALPEGLKSSLPSIEEIEAELSEE